MSLHNTKNLSILGSKLLPAERCAICDRTLNEVGGKRLTASKLRGVVISDTPIDDSKYTFKSLLLTEEPQLYLYVWGEESKWTEEAIERARQDCLSGYLVWFCQCCGERKCSDCGSPITTPIGYDVLNDDGTNPHIGMYGFDSGCSNSECSNHKS